MASHDSRQLSAIVFVLWFDIVIIYVLFTYFSIYADRSYFVWPFFQPHRDAAYLGQPLLDRLVDIFSHVQRKINSLRGSQPKVYDYPLVNSHITIENHHF